MNSKYDRALQCTCSQGDHAQGPCQFFVSHSVFCCSFAFVQFSFARGMTESLYLYFKLLIETVHAKIL